MLKTVLSLLLWTIPVLWLAFGVWSWRMVRRNELRGALLPLRAIPGLAMGVFGLGMWLYVAVTQSLAAAGGGALGDAVATGPFWREMAIALPIGYPLWLWGDFLFRRGLGWFLKVERRPSAPPPTASDA